MNQESFDEQLLESARKQFKAVDTSESGMISTDRLREVRHTRRLTLYLLRGYYSMLEFSVHCRFC